MPLTNDIISPHLRKLHSALDYDFFNQIGKKLEIPFVNTLLAYFNQKSKLGNKFRKISEIICSDMPFYIFS